MHVHARSFALCLAIAFLLAEHAATAAAQQPDAEMIAAGFSGAPPPPGFGSAGTLPDSPSQSQAPDAAAQKPASGGGDSAQTAQPQDKHQEAEQELKQEEKQRVLGVMPSFNTSYNWHAASLSGKQKMDLAFHSAVDPFTFGVAFAVAGLHEALDEDPGFGWGAEGYFKRSGAAYLDAFDGAMIGNGILPAIFRQDPRYFRLGVGSFHRRLFYAIATSYICRGDNGKWQPNYSNVGGNIIAGAISNLYYPSQNSGWGQSISNGFIVTTEGTFGGVFQEFWPDLSRKMLHRDPTHGADAKAQAEYKAEQAARKKAKKEKSGAASG